MALYCPSHFAAPDEDSVKDLICEASLATIVVDSPQGLYANMVPLLYEDGLFRGHVARANQLWKACQSSEGIPCLLVFRGEDGYVSPSMYPTKQSNEKVVPTWDFVTFQIRGVLRAHPDKDWTRQVVHDLTTRHESEAGSSWAMSDAPDSYIDQMLSAIVGISIEVATPLKEGGKWKVSQNRPLVDRVSVAQRFKSQGKHKLADLVFRNDNGVSNGIIWIAGGIAAVALMIGTGLYLKKTE